MKNVKTFLFTIIGIFLLFSCSASAASTVTTSEIYSLANGDYLETILIQDSTSRATSSTKSGQKTTYYKSSSGVTLWSVTVKQVFLILMENPAPVPLLLEVLLPVLLLGKFPVLLLKKMGIQQLHQQLGITIPMVL